MTTIYNRLADIFEVKYTLDWRTLNDSNREIVHIMWPEELIICDDDIDEFCLFLGSVKLLVYTAHNKLPHNFSNRQIDYRKLYLLMIEKSHLIIHMGVFSLKSQISLYGFKEKCVMIPHPILDFQLPTGDVDSSWSVDYKNIHYKNVILVSGSTRRKREFVLSLIIHLLSYKKNNFLYFTRVPLNWFFHNSKFIGKYRLRKFIKLFFEKLLNIGYGQGAILEEASLVSQIVMSRVVLLPRISNYNSGIPFLVAQFGKPMIAFNTGNWVEYLKLSDCNFIIELKNCLMIRRSLNFLVNDWSSSTSISKEIHLRCDPEIVAKQTAYHILSKYDKRCC